MYIQIDHSELEQKLEAIATRLNNTSQLMQSISLSFLDTTEENFAAQGRPAWAGWSADYARARKGGRILQDSGQLAGSITASHTVNTASIGSNKVYAAIHQFGGMAGRGRKSSIPARPYLPIDKSGNLQKDAVDSVIDAVDHHIAQATK